MRRRTVWALVVAGGLLVQPPARGGSEPPPDVIEGVLVIHERGPAVMPIGFLSAFLGTAPAMGGVARAVKYAERLLQDPEGEAAAAGGEHASMGRVSELMRNEVPGWLALPVSARREARVRFELVPEKPGARRYVLRSGTIDWEAHNRSRYEDAQNGGRSRFEDVIDDGGSQPLDPERSEIVLELRRDGSYVLSVDALYTARPSGRSTWTVSRGGQELVELRLDLKEGEGTIDAGVFGMSQPEYFRTLDRAAEGMEKELARAGGPTGAASPLKGYRDLVQAASGAMGAFPIDLRVEQGVHYTVVGWLSEMKGLETWRDPMENQVVAEHQLWTRCQARIVKPSADGPWSQWLFGAGRNPVTLEGEVVAEVTPFLVERQLEWTLPEIPGFELTTDPEDRRGSRVRFRYEGRGAPPELFIKKGYEVTASFGDRASECEDPDPQRARLFFQQKAKTHDQYWNRDAGPNWYHYWNETSARGPVPKAKLYHDRGCESGVAAAYVPSIDKIRVCDALAIYNPLTEARLDGIDAYAATLLHEWAHREHHLAWRGQPDRDGDDIPDSEEARFGADPDDPISLLRASVRAAGHQDGEITPEARAYLTDEEVLAHRAEEAWRVKSADPEDWACVGHQCEEGP